MQYTLLDLTQTILSSMDSDEINSISDTTEAMQVAKVIRTAYFNIIARSNLPEHKTIFQLDPSGDVDKPVLMTSPTNVSRIEWIKYNTETADDTSDTYTYVTILPIQQFIDMMHQLDPESDEGDVGTMVVDGQTYFYKNDQAPRFCTIVKDTNIIFDAIDLDVDSILQASKTMCYGQTIPTFTLSDSFIPDMDAQQFPLLLNEAKSLAFYELKQMTHDKAEQESKRQWRTLQRTKSLEKPNYLDAFPDYGRH